MTTPRISARRPVIVAGAGPVGSSFALLLAAKGVPVVLLERNTAVAEDLRASTFHPPTLDMLDAIGMTQKLKDMGLIVSRYQYRDRRTGDIAEFDLGVLAGETRHPYRVQCEQWRLSQACIDVMNTLPQARVHFSHKVVGASNTDAGVTVDVETPGGRVQFQGAYLFGCDGASSAVRQYAGIEYGGFTYPEKFLVASTPYPLEELLPRLAGVNYVSDPEEWCVVLRCNELWRVLFPTTPGESEEKLLSDAYIQERLHHLAPKSGDFVIGHRTLYDVHQRVASTYRAGRILLGGDAAHINNPLGGMGMNGGIHDGVNLADKLFAVYEGRADESVLDVYDRQRRITAQNFVQEHTINNKRLMEEKDPDAQRKRQAHFMRTAADPILAKEFLMKVAMINCVRESYAIR
jgi:3-(3-hydroxy-phenyl)propionate hydroxylase